tara:strand:+ start:652 stop:2079 length:1428 start_codon:yes stop_codon:yes gene_type:complete
MVVCADRTPLHSAKATILASLKQVLACPNLIGDSREQDYYTHSIELESIDIVGLLPFIDMSQKVLFCDREGERQYLGLKFIKTFSDTFSLERARKLIIQNPQLILLGGQRFHPGQRPSPEWESLGSHFYVLPQFIFSRKNQQTRLLINIPKAAFSNSTLAVKLLMELEGILTFKGHAQKKFSFKPYKQIPSFDQWQTQVAKAHKSFDQNELDKVVLSRKEVLSSQELIKPDQVFEHLALKAGEHFIFHIQWRHDQSFTSMTPERLFKLSGQDLYSDAIAGTRARGINQDADLVLQHELLNSKKELNEHRFVSSAIKETMNGLGCYEVEVSDSETILKLSHVQHLYTKLKAKLLKTPKILDLIEAFHPTPAVGGKPKSEAIEWLLSTEEYDRGYFAAPVGVIDANGAEFCVAIRSALVFARELHVYAGAGLVPGSCPTAEWNETAVKMKNFTSKFTHTTVKAPKSSEMHNEQHPSH